MEFESEEMGLSNAIYDVHLEMLAQLIESSATSVEDAARIVRGMKIANQKTDDSEGCKANKKDLP